MADDDCHARSIPKELYPGVHGKTGKAEERVGNKKGSEKAPLPPPSAEGNVRLLILEPTLPGYSASVSAKTAAAASAIRAPPWSARPVG